MSNLNKDILLYISEEFENDGEPLFSCLLVNKLWFETFVPILWKEPWKFLEKNQENKLRRVSLLFNIIVLHLPEASRKLLANQGIKQLSLQQKPLVNYVSYCNKLNLKYVHTYINLLICSGSEFDYQRYVLEQEIYKLFMSTCPSLKYLNLDFQLQKHQLHNFPGANTCLSELVHLQCTTNTDPAIFYGLSLICQKLEKISIMSFLNRNFGLDRLIQVQKNLKDFKFEIDKFTKRVDQKKESCKGLGIALMKHSNSLLQFKLHLDREIDFPPFEFYQKFKNLRVLILLNIDNITYFDSRFSLINCPKLEVLQLGFSSQISLSKIISRTEGSLWYIRAACLYVKNQSQELIQTIYQRCPELTSVHLVVDNDDFRELQQLLTICRNLYEIILESRKRGKIMSNGDILLDLLVKFAPVDVDVIELVSNWKITVKDLEKFLENWRNRVPSYLLEFRTSYVPNMTDEHFKVLDRYKEEGIIKFYQNTQ